VVAQVLQPSSVRKIMLLPARPSARLCNILNDTLKIDILTYSRSEQGEVRINGLKALKGLTRGDEVSVKCWSLVV